MAKLGPGARVGDQFSLIRKIGEGGCGEVYLAEQTSLGRNTVVKLMHPELSRDASYVARFRREAQLAAKLTHHHTAAIYAFGETPERVLWIAMEYIEGESLHNVLAKDSAQKIGELLAPVADVLDRAGALGIIHRDVKPDNIIVSSDGIARRAVLLDFGLARPMEDNDKLTAVGVAVGSPTYMSPEQVFGPAVDSATDRYALGIILYIAVAKRPPFRHDDRVQLVLMHKRQPVPALSSLVPGIPAGHPLDPFFTKALAKQPQDRYPSARQMIAEFQLALAESPLHEGGPVQVAVPVAAPVQAPTPPAPVPPVAPRPAPPPPRTPPLGVPPQQPAASLGSVSGRRTVPPPSGGPKPGSSRPDPRSPAAPNPRPKLQPLVPPASSGRPSPERAQPSEWTPPPVPAKQKSETTLQMADGLPAGAVPDETDTAEASAIAPLLGHPRLQAQIVSTSRCLDVLCATEATLGKHRDCDLVCRAFPTPEQDAITHGVSRQHARLRVVSGKLLLEDLASLNGTYLDDKRITGGPVPLYDEARLRLGPVLTIEVRMFRSGAALLRRVDPYHGDFPATLLLWDKVALGEPVLGLVPQTGDSVTRWGTLQRSREGNELWWGGPVAVTWQRLEQSPPRPQALQPLDRLLMGSTIVEWQAGTKPGLG